MILGIIWLFLQVGAYLWLPFKIRALLFGGNFQGEMSGVLNDAGHACSHVRVYVLICRCVHIWLYLGTRTSVRKNICIYIYMCEDIDTHIYEYMHLHG